MKPIWRTNAALLLADAPSGPVVAASFVALLRLMHRKQWRGACHAASAVLHVVLAQRGIASNVCLGEAALRRFPFDHSWIEIDDAVYDAAITLPLEPSMAAPPTIRGRDAETLGLSSVQYGIRSGQPAGADAEAILDMSFGAFMEMEQNLWVFAADLLGTLGEAERWEVLRERHATIGSWQPR